MVSAEVSGRAAAEVPKSRPAPFVERPLPRRTFWEWLLRRPPSRAAVVAVENLLARARSVSDVPDEALDDISARYRVPVSRRFPDELADLYRRFVASCLRDRRLSGDEIADLDHLKRVLGLSDRQVASAHDAAAGEVFRSSVDQAIADGRLTGEEKQFLARLQQQLQLDPALAKAIYAEEAQGKLTRAIDEAVADERLSPAEDAEIAAIAASLGSKIELDHATRADLDRFRRYWLIENGELPAIDVPIHLYKGERCYFSIAATWYEQHRVTRRIRYGGPTVRLRIAKGIYWRMGDVGVQRVSEDIMARVGSGTLYLTERRLLFVGDRKNSTIRLSRILDYKPYKNGVDIGKDSGKNPFFELDRDVDLFCMYLDRALRDA